MGSLILLLNDTFTDTLRKFLVLKRGEGHDAQDKDMAGLALLLDISTLIMLCTIGTTEGNGGRVGEGGGGNLLQ